MFMQIIQGKIKDRESTRATMDRWLTDLQPGAAGWLGGTYGVTDDNELVACVRFADAASAKANSNRPEQGAWWAEMEKNFDGPVTFHDCDDVTLLLGGGSDDAGFVQVIQARVKDRAQLLRLVEQGGQTLQQQRPDVIGGTIAIDAQGVVTETIAFRSEAAARENEAKEMSEEARKMMALLEDPHYLDLHHPWFASASQKRQP
jgi:hypothetical protein